jgi:hypothetical protein
MADDSGVPFLHRWDVIIGLLALIATLGFGMASLVGGDNEAGGNPGSDRPSPTTTMSSVTTARPPITTTTTAPATTVPPSTGSTSPPPPAQTALADLDQVNDHYWFENDSDEPMKIDGTSHLRGIYSGVIGGCISSWEGTSQTIEYSIDRLYTNFSAVIGLTNQSDSGLPLKLDVAVDGSTRWSETLQVGQAQQVDIDVEGGLRLTITATQVADDDAGCAHAALGSPVLE